MLAGPLFALGHDHEVLGRLDVQLLADVVADHDGGLAASLAGALFRRAGDHSLHARQPGGQLLASGMRTGFPVRRRQRLAFAFRLDFDVAHSWFQFQEFQLRRVELLASRTVLLDPLEPQLLFQRVDLQMGQGQRALQCDDLIGFGSLGSGGRDVHGE